MRLAVAAPGTRRRWLEQARRDAGQLPREGSGPTSRRMVSSWQPSPGGRVGVTWSHPGFDYGDAISVTAHPFRGVLAVEGLRVFNDGGQRRLSFDVVNVGTRAEIAFGLGFGWVDR